jgi:hypothetical protein
LQASIAKMPVPAPDVRDDATGADCGAQRSHVGLHARNVEDHLPVVVDAVHPAKPFRAFLTHEIHSVVRSERRPCSRTDGGSGSA